MTTGPSTANENTTLRLNGSNLPLRMLVNSVSSTVLAIGVLATVPAGQPISSNHLLVNGLMRDVSSSRPTHLPGELTTLVTSGAKATRLQRTRALRGKYTRSLSSSTAFAAQKEAEKALE